MIILTETDHNQTGLPIGVKKIWQYIAKHLNIKREDGSGRMPIRIKEALKIENIDIGLKNSIRIENPKTAVNI